MIDYFIQNFSLGTFILSLAVFMAGAGIINISSSYIRLQHARKQVQRTEQGLEELKEKLKMKSQELEAILFANKGARN